MGSTHTRSCRQYCSSNVVACSLCPLQKKTHCSVNCWPMMFRGQTLSSVTDTQLVQEQWLLHLQGREGHMMKSNICVVWFQSHAGENTEHGCIKLRVHYWMLPLVKETTHTHYMDDFTMCHTAHKMTDVLAVSVRWQRCSILEDSVLTHMQAFITDCDYSNSTHVIGKQTCCISEHCRGICLSSVKIYTFSCKCSSSIGIFIVFFFLALADGMCFSSLASAH